MLYIFLILLVITKVPLIQWPNDKLVAKICKDTNLISTSDQCPIIFHSCRPFHGRLDHWIGQTEKSLLLFALCPALSLGIFICILQLYVTFVSVFVFLLYSIYNTDTVYKQNLYYYLHLIIKLVRISQRQREVCSHLLARLCLSLFLGICHLYYSGFSNLHLCFCPTCSQLPEVGILPFSNMYFCIFV